MPDALNNREGPQAREPSKCLNGWSYGERPAKEAFWVPATRGLKKNSDRAITPVARQSVSLHARHSQGSPQANQLHHVHAQLSQGQSCHRQKNKEKKVLCLCVQGCFGPVRLFGTLWTVPSQASLSGMFSRQEYWRVLTNTGCHILLEHYIFYYPSRQPPWVPGAARTPATQAAAPPPHLALTGANPTGRPTCRGGNKTTIETQDSVAKEEDPKPSHQLYKLQIKSTWSTRQTLCLWNI